MPEGGTAVYPLLLQKHLKASVVPKVQDQVFSRSWVKHIQESKMLVHSKCTVVDRKYSASPGLSADFAILIGYWFLEYPIRRKTMNKLTWYGHATLGLQTDGHQLVIDPFFTDNPAASTTAGAGGPRQVEPL